MEGSDHQEPKMCEMTRTMDTRWIILGPGKPPQHIDNWTQFRVGIKEKREHGTWLLQLIDAENNNVGDPFTAVKTALCNSQEEVDAALGTRLAGIRDR